MVNGAHGEITPLVLKAAELGAKQEHVLAITLLHLEGDMSALDHRQNQEIVTPKLVQVRIPSFSFDCFQNTFFVLLSSIFNKFHCFFN